MVSSLADTTTTARLSRQLLHKISTVVLAWTQLLRSLWERETDQHHHSQLGEYCSHSILPMNIPMNIQTVLSQMVSWLYTI